jgi:hypothetical protein
VTALAYVAVEAGWWPPSLAEAAPPASLPIIVAIFGLLVHLISFISVIRQITRLADPYFVTNDRSVLQIGGFGARQVTATVQRADTAVGVPRMKAPNLFAIQCALEEGGVVFLDPGEHREG